VPAPSCLLAGATISNDDESPLEEAEVMAFCPGCVAREFDGGCPVGRRPAWRPAHARLCSMSAAPKTDPLDVIEIGNGRSIVKYANGSEEGDQLGVFVHEPDGTEVELFKAQKSFDGAWTLTRLDAVGISEPFGGWGPLHKIGVQTPPERLH